MTGISRITALAIQHNPDLTICAALDEASNKWLGFLHIIDAKERPRIILSTEPQFDSEASAKQYLNEIVDSVKKSDIFV